MTGGGLAGSAIVLVAAAEAATVAESVRGRFATEGYLAPEIFSVRPGPGAPGSTGSPPAGGHEKGPGFGGKPGSASSLAPL